MKNIIQIPEIMYATDFEEFYYEDSNEVVPEGEVVGFDFQLKDGVHFKLLKNIYWNPQYPDPAFDDES